MSETPLVVNQGSLADLEKLAAERTHRRGGGGVRRGRVASEDPAFEYKSLEEMEPAEAMQWLEGVRQRRLHAYNMYHASKLTDTRIQLEKIDATYKKNLEMFNKELERCNRAIHQVEKRFRNLQSLEGQKTDLSTQYDELASDGSSRTETDTPNLSGQDRGEKNETASENS